jgi:hypothetical protein
VRMIASRRVELETGMQAQASFCAGSCDKMEGTSRTSGGNLRYYTEEPSGCQIR